MYPRQGEPVAENLHPSAQWVIYERIFLYEPIEAIASVPRAQFTTGLQRYDGETCIGFSWSQVAAALGVTSKEVLSANIDGSLIFHGCAQIPPSHGGLTATAYGFSIGDRRGYITVEKNQNEGTA